MHTYFEVICRQVQQVTGEQREHLIQFYKEESFSEFLCECAELGIISKEVANFLQYDMFNFEIDEETGEYLNYYEPDYDKVMQFTKAVLGEFSIWEE